MVILNCHINRNKIIFTCNNWYKLSKVLKETKSVVYGSKIIDIQLSFEEKSIFLKSSRCTLSATKDVLCISPIVGDTLFFNDAILEEINYIKEYMYEVNGIYLEIIHDDYDSTVIADAVDINNKIIYDNLSDVDSDDIMYLEVFINESKNNVTVNTNAWKELIGYRTEILEFTFVKNTNIC